MKNVLLAGTALLSIVAFSSVASAQVKLDLGGHFRGYVVNVDDDNNNLREMDFRRDVEVHFTGETTLNNGLTVGVHVEQAIGEDGVSNANSTDEVYAYFSGGWGRVNFGSEDGAAYLLQVAAPSADSNVDGLRTYIQALTDTAAGQLNWRALDGSGAVAASYETNNFGAFGTRFDGIIDYDHADFRQTDRITYLTPKFSGFQAGISYAPEMGQNAIGNNLAGMAADNNNADSASFGAGALGAAAGMTAYEDIWDLAVRWDGEFSGFGISLGAGYSEGDTEASVALGAPVAGNAGDVVLNGDFSTWNLGANVAFGGFSVGAAYKESAQEFSANIFDETNLGATRNSEVERETWVIGGAWDNGPYHVGVSYLEQETSLPTLSNLNAVNDATDFAFQGTDNEVKKFTIGGGYTFGPGMTFRGAVAFGEYESAATAFPAATNWVTQSNDFTQITLGTDIQF